MADPLGTRIAVMDREMPALGRANVPDREIENERSEAAAQRTPLRMAYLVNQYPKVSHSFIRREIQAVERQRVSVTRIAIRGWNEPLADAQDLAERERTRFVLKEGWGALLGATARAAIRAPRQFGSALLEALRLSRGAERPLPYHLVYLAEACLILEWLRADDITHLHAHFGTNPAEVAMLVRMLGGPEYSVTVHGPDEFDKAHLLHLDKKIGRAKFVAAVNSYCRAQLFRQAAHADWSKIKLVHCGLEKEFYDAADRQPTRGRLVCVGRLCEQKGQLVLLEAFARLRKKVSDCHLVLAGDGEMRADIEARMSALKLTGAVTITGWISSADVRQEILSSEALVLPSFQESLPVVLMEAMALKRPVISTYVAGIPELVIPGETGWLVPAASIEPLVAAMEACLTAPPGMLSRMGEAGHLRVVGRHDIDGEAAKLVGLFASGSVRHEIEEWQP